MHIRMVYYAKISDITAVNIVSVINVFFSYIALIQVLV